MHRQVIVGTEKRGASANYRNRMFKLMCYAYIVLGTCSIIAGIMVYFLPFFLNHRHPLHIDVGTGFVIAVLVIFGAWRIATGVFNLRRLSLATSAKS